jgi:molybdopterin-dependent oxidoreductase alpha subunit
VQGDRTVGIWERPSESLLDALSDEFDFEPPRHHGFDAAGAIEAMKRGDARFFFAMGGNYLSATPDTDYTAQALQTTELTVHVSTKLNRSHLVTGENALILPCLGRTDKDIRNGINQFVTVENSMGYVHPSRGRLEPPSESLLSEPEIVARMATNVLGKEYPIDWMWHVVDYDRIRALIGRTIPGFESFNERLMDGDGFYLPNVVREGSFGTPDGKAHFKVHPIPGEELDGDELMLMTIRSHDQYNTTIYGMDDRYRGIENERRVIFMHPEDIKARGLQADDVVDLVGPEREDGSERIAAVFRVVPYDLPPGCCGAYFPEANPVVPADRLAEKSRTPSSKSVPIRVRKNSAGERV